MNVMNVLNARRSSSYANVAHPLALLQGESQDSQSRDSGNSSCGSPDVMRKRRSAPPMAVGQQAQLLLLLLLQLLMLFNLYVPVVPTTLRVRTVLDIFRTEESICTGDSSHTINFVGNCLYTGEKKIDYFL